MRNLVVRSALALLLVPGVLPQESPATGTLEGTVTRSDTGEPLAGAVISLSTVSLTPPRTSSPVASDNNGKFTIRDLAAGTYRVAAAAAGFIKQEYGQRAFNAQGRAVFITAGQTLGNIAIALPPAGIVSGRVFDDSGQPAVDAAVQVIRGRYDAYGRGFQLVRGVTTNDRGEYRIFDVPPGRYFLLAGSLPGPQRSPFGSAPANYSIVFYRDAEDIERASLIEVKAGSDAPFDLRVRKQIETYRVRGRIVGANGLPATERVSVTLGYQNYGTGGGGGLPARNFTFDPATGAFEIPAMPRGTFYLSAMIPPPNPGPGFSGTVDSNTALDRFLEFAAQPTAYARLHVVDSNLDNVVLTMRTAASRSGRVVVGEEPLSSVGNVGRMRLSLAPSMPPIEVGDSPVAQTVRENGSFEVRGLLELEYRVRLDGVAPGFYVKSIQYGGKDVLTVPLKFSNSSSGTFEVTLGRTAAQINGRVIDAQSRPVSGVQAVLIPAQHNRADLYRTALADSRGQYSMTQVAPGDYQLFSWEAAESGPYYDPDFLKRHEQNAQAVRVEESSNLNVDVTLIPAP